MPKKSVSLQLYDISLLITLLLLLIFHSVFNVDFTRFNHLFLQHVLGCIGTVGIALVLFFIARCLIDRLQAGEFDGKQLRVLAKRHFGLGLTARIIRFAVAIQVVMIFYTTLKQHIPMLNSAIYDNQLLAIEKFIHFGLSPSHLLASAPLPTFFVQFLDAAYIAWFPFQVFVFAFMFTTKDELLKSRFVAAFTIIWTAGVLIGLTFPSQGPFMLAGADTFPPAGMEFASHIQSKVAQHYAAFNGDYNAQDVVFGFGLMALPSLHVALAFLSLVAFWRISRAWRRFHMFYTVVIFIGSLVTGWHYAVDGYAGMLLVLAVWKVIGMVQSHSNLSSLSAPVESEGSDPVGHASSEVC